MAQRGEDYGSLPGSLGSTPKHPLSKSLSRPSSPLRPMSDRGPQSPSLHNQAVLRSCREQNPDYFMPQQPQSPAIKKTAFSLHTTPTSDRPPPLSPPVHKSKFLSRSFTFSPSLGSKVGRNLHCPDSTTSSDLPSPSEPSAESLSSSSENDLKVQPRDLKNPSPSQADGPAAAAVFVKSLFRSSTFASRDSKPDQSASSPSKPAEPAKSFFRSSSFAHKDPGFSIAKSLSKSFSNLSSHDQQEQAHEPSSLSGFSKWARSFRSKPATTAEPVVEIPESSPYSLFSGSPSASSSSKRASSRVFPIEELENSFGVLTKGFLDSSKNAVKVVQDKARHLVSQRNQDDVLDMVYITESIIAVGFPGAETSSNILGFSEANYQDLVEELITFCEAEHLGRYKIFNLCSEKLYNTSILHDKVACFPFQGGNCPPLQLVSAFCEAAYAWLKEGLENVVVVHCKGGMARTGLMISCLLLHLKFYPTAEESMNHYNQKRSADSNALNLPSQLRYLKYYEQVLRKHHGFTPTGRRCALRSIRLINCPTWIRPAVTVSDHDGLLFWSMKHPSTRSMLTEDLWLGAMRRGEFVFELPDDGHAATVDGDFKIQFQCYHADFACWLNTNLAEEKAVLRANDLDGFDTGLLETAEFQVELELVDTDSPIFEVTSTGELGPTSLRSGLPSDPAAGRTSSSRTVPNADEETKIFSDSEGEDSESPGISARPSTSKQADWSHSQPDTLRSTLFNAIPEISTGILNAIDRFSMTHLRREGSSTKSASMPNSPRISSSDGYNNNNHTHGSSARSADGSGGDFASWLISGSGSGSGSRSSQFQELFTSNFERDEEEPMPTISYIPGKVIIDGMLNPELAESENNHPSKLSFQSDDDGECLVVSSDIPSDFQALATASAADASLFTFVDEEDYDSDEV